jgi:hypothetical protein
MNTRYSTLGLLGLIGVVWLPGLVGTCAGDAAPAVKEPTHWAFRSVVAPDVPKVKNTTWVRTPVDNFILARLEENGLKPAPVADKQTLLRRVYFDLIGLPPTPAEQNAFLEDTAPDAFAKVVDALLARPEYGQRWARHWLDVARYAETNGYERDGVKPSAWRYRDYVIDALNKDKPYDRFLTEQLAGDELPNATVESRIATTFLRLGTWDDEPAEKLVDRYDQLDDVLGVTASAFLGVTLRCARCHDHKFDPFSQGDYYRMLAVFEPLKRPQKDRADLDVSLGNEATATKSSAAEALADAERLLLQKKLETWLHDAGERLFAADASALPVDAIRAFQADPNKRDAEQKALAKQYAAQLEKEIAAAATEEERRQRKEIDDRLLALRASRTDDMPRAYIWYEEGPKAPPTHIFKRGDPNKPGVEVQPGLPSVLVRKQPEPPQPTKTSTGRRLWLAHWLTQPDNPLTARVMVNRVWQYHFGKGIVATPSNFGLMGDAPTHPELLDYLADRFVKDGWSLKKLHRLLVLSNTYQTSSATEAGEKQGEMKLALFGRWRQRRLEAEAVRDAVLAVSGDLNSKRGGPGIYPPLPRAVLEGQSRPGEGWVTSETREAARRSIYIFAKRSLCPPELELLDKADSTSSCEQRPVSTTAPQALTLLNGAFMQEQSAHFAARLEKAAGADPADQVRLAYRLALCRPPRTEEVELAIAFLTKQQQLIENEARTAKQSANDAKTKALAALCLVLLNLNEFAYPG